MNEYKIKITDLPPKTEDQLYRELIDWYIKLMAVAFSISPDDLRKDRIVRKNYNLDKTP